MSYSPAWGLLGTEGALVAVTSGQGRAHRGSTHGPRVRPPEVTRAGAPLRGRTLVPCFSLESSVGELER